MQRAYFAGTKSIPGALICRHELFVIILKRLTRAECGKLTPSLQARPRGRMSLLQG
jgi:hypothetical protein